MLEKARVLNLNNAINLRELGGYQTLDGKTVKWHKLLRSGGLYSLTADDTQELVDYGWKINIDFRGHSETAYLPDPEVAAVSYHNLSVYPFAGDQAAGLWARVQNKLRLHAKVIFKQNYSSMSETYSKMLTDSHAISVFQQFMQLVLENDQPQAALLFHCAAGKDRTGVAAMILENALGLKPELIRRDYLLTNLVLAGNNEKTRQELNRSTDPFVAQMNAMNADTENYAAVQTTITNIWGDWPTYFREALKLSAADLKLLQQIYLE